jgi:hypothetical protein
MRIVVFCGPKGSGKDSAAKTLLSQNSILTRHLFIQINFADTLKQVVCNLFGLTPEEVADPVLKEKVLDRWPNVTPRHLLQNFAATQRTLYSPDIFVRGWSRKMDMRASMDFQCVLVTDLRHQEELDELRTRGAIIIYVHNPRVEQERIDGIARGDPLWTDVSEAMAESLRLHADAVLENDGISFDLLHTNTHALVKSLIGDWTQWPS